MKIPVIKVETEKNPDVFLRTDKPNWKKILAKYCAKKKVIDTTTMQIEESEYLRGKLN